MKQKIEKQSLEEKISQTTEQIPKLTQLLQRDENGKPKLNLTPIENTEIYTMTHYCFQTLMRVYECGGWKWDGSGRIPTELDPENITHRKEAYSDIKHCNERKREFGFTDRRINTQNSYDNIISSEEFYKTQKITYEIISEINIWFDKNNTQNGNK